MKIYLDLLPQERKDELKRKKTFAVIIRRQLLFLFPMAVFMVILVNTYLILGIQKDSMVATGSGQQSQGEYKQLHVYEDAFGQTNNLVIFLSRAQNQHIYWSRLIAKISSIASDSIYLTELSTKDYHVMMSGKAKTRDDLIAFKEAIANSGCADDVNLPLSNLVSPANVDFQIDFTVKQGCIENVSSK